MSGGLLALLDDVAALVKVTAASLDDIPAQVAKTTGKVSGIVIDDTAVTPKYVVGLSPERELAIIFNIAKRSMTNKLVFLGPAALLLGYFAPWLIQPVLMLGGGYLCFEGYEKVHGMFARHDDAQEEVEVIAPEELEKMRVKSAVQTDFILSGEIIAITYGTVADQDVVTQVGVLACIAVGITVAVYGVVGVIVKADDVGLHLAKRSRFVFMQRLGRKIVTCMPGFLVVLGYIGTVAMLWVGAEIIAHGVPVLHHGLEQAQRRVPDVAGLAWGVKALLCAMGGLVVGAVIGQVVALKGKIIPARQGRSR